MLTAELEQSWKVVKESYPDSIVFQEMDGFYIVRGRDLDVLREELGVGTSSPWWGFDEGPAVGYIHQLVERGRKVVIATNNGVSPARLPADRTKELRRRRKRAKYLAIEPRLLFDETAIDRVVTDKWIQRRGYHDLFEQFKTWLCEGDTRSLRQCGELYVYPVGDWYELDHDITSMLNGHVLLLAKAALAVRAKVPCQVVRPAGHRHRHPDCPKPEAAEAAHALGQLSFADAIDWPAS
jgi:hypothetical protein